MIKTGTLLTKSYKDRDRCVAVFDEEDRKIIRLLLNEDPKSSIPKELVDDIDLLDQVEFDIIKTCAPIGPQTENVLIDKNYGIIKTGRKKGNIEYIYNATNRASDYVFYNKKRFLDKYQLPNYSLGLFKVSNLEIHIETYTKNDGSIEEKYRAYFIYKGNFYEHFSMTDPKFCKAQFNKCFIKKAYILLSLPALPYEYNDKYYKLVSAIYPLDEIKLDSKRLNQNVHNVNDYNKIFVLEDLEDGSIFNVRICSDNTNEQNDVENINAETPLAKKLLGRIKGDTFGIELNNGLIAFYKVVDIK